MLKSLSVCQYDLQPWKSGKKSSSQKYYWRPPFNRSTIGDHLSWDTHQGRLSHWRPQSVHWRPQDFNRKPPDFDWRPEILIEDPQIFIGDTQFFIGDPRIFMGDPKVFIVDPRFALETGGLQIFIGNTNDDNYFPDSLKVHSQWCVFKIVSRKCAFKVCPESVSWKCVLKVCPENVFWKCVLKVQFTSSLHCTHNKCFVMRSKYMRPPYPCFIVSSPPLLQQWVLNKTIAWESSFARTCEMGSLLNFKMGSNV